MYSYKRRTKERLTKIEIYVIFTGENRNKISVEQDIFLKDILITTKKMPISDQE